MEQTAEDPTNILSILYVPDRRLQAAAGTHPMDKTSSCLHFSFQFPLKRHTTELWCQISKISVKISGFLT
jgi:hypothetical protein